MVRGTIPNWYDSVTFGLWKAGKIERFETQGIEHDAGCFSVERRYSANELGLVWIEGPYLYAYSIYKNHKNRTDSFKYYSQQNLFFQRLIKIKTQRTFLKPRNIKQ